MSQLSDSSVQMDRTSAMRRIAANLGLATVHPVVWSLLSHADEARLSSLENSSSGNQREELARMLKGPCALTNAVVQWLYRTRIRYPSLPQATPTATVVADTMNKCYERSHSCCITSTDEPTEIAHIAPLHIGGEDMEERNRRNFWRVMRVFFGGERVDRWMAATARPVSQTNLMCVSDNVHGLYEKARFVLRPISQDSDGVKAEFYWLPYMEYEMRTLGECASSDVNQISSPFGCKLFECTTETKIVCGSVVEFKTEPVEVSPAVLGYP